MDVVGASGGDRHMTRTPQYVARGRVARVESCACRGVLGPVVMGKADADLGVAPHGEAGAVERVGTRGTPDVGAAKA